MVDEKIVMENDINIAKILIDKPLGTKLYADAFGELSLERVKVNEEDIIHTRNKISTLYLFYNDGKFSKDGEPILVPSKKMRDWSKFAWKKGDVLVSDDGCIEVIFDKWYDDTYTNFYGKHYLDSENENDIVYIEVFICTTERFSLEDKESLLCYINTIEERLGGKLNLKTLEIEKHPEFKDGDILHSDETEYSDETIFIAKISGRVIGTYAYIVLLDESVMIQNDPFKKSEINAIRLATDSEKQQLFDALAKKGKAWDAEKKQIVDLKPKIDLKPFDKVLVRDGNDEIWEPAFFFRNRPELNVYKYQTVGGKLRVYCIPFNEETAKLIGTSNDWEE